MEAPSAIAPPTPPKKKPKLLLGCGLSLVALVVLFVIAALLSPDAPTPTKTNKTNAPAAKSGDIARYAGKWQGADGTSLWIRGDGKGDYDGGNTKVSGGGVTIDETAKTLAITSFFGIGKTWKIESAPQNADSPQMKLDGVVYRRHNAFAPQR